jgi:pyrroloquinoline quinone biosynthesis protein D
MPLDEVFAFSPVASFQSVGDGAVVLLADSGQLYSCNETSEAFLRHVDGRRSLGEIVELLTQEYEVERHVLEADLAELAESLKQEGVIVSGEK